MNWYCVIKYKCTGNDSSHNIEGYVRKCQFSQDTGGQAADQTMNQY